MQIYTKNIQKPNFVNIYFIYFLSSKGESNSYHNFGRVVCLPTDTITAYTNVTNTSLYSEFNFSDSTSTVAVIPFSVSLFTTSIADIPHPASSHR